MRGCAYIHRLIQIVTTVQVFNFDVRNEHGMKSVLTWLLRDGEGLKFVGRKTYPVDYSVDYFALAIEIRSLDN